MNNSSKPLSERKNILKDLAEQTEKVTDGLGKPIEDDIKNIVIMLNAFKLLTRASCAGHLNKWSYGAPWVMVGSESPIDQDSTTENDELRERIIQETSTMRARTVSLLEQFYKTHNVDYSVMLHPDGGGYFFRIKSIGLEEFNSLDDETRERLLPIYSKEMNDFADFLRNKFLNEGPFKTNSN